MTNNTEQQAVPVAQEIERIIRKIDVQAKCLEGYAESNGFSTNPIPSVFHFQATHFRDIANELRMQLSASLPCKSGEGANLDRPALLAAAHAWWARNMPGSHFKTATIKGNGRVDVHWQDSEESGSYTLPVNFTALTPDATQTREAELVAAAQAVLDNADRPGSRMQFGNDGDVWIDHKEVDQAVLDRLSAALNARGGA